MQEICHLLGIKKSRTSPYHPQCEERSNRTILDMLATTTWSHPFDWEDQLPKVYMAYNTSVHASTDYTPFFFMFGRQARLPIDLVYGTSVRGGQASVSEYATFTKHALEEAYRLVHHKLDAAHCIQKKHYDKKVHGKPFAVSDLVWLRCQGGLPRSFTTHGLGRTGLLLKSQQMTVKRNRKVQVVHFDRLKHCDPSIRLDDL